MDFSGIIPPYFLASTTAAMVNLVIAFKDPLILITTILGVGLIIEALTGRK